jgi:hypothetical protein
VSDFALFTIGTIVFFLGATGLALFGLDTFRVWSEADPDPDDEQLGDDEVVREGLTEPR